MRKRWAIFVPAVLIAVIAIIAWDSGWAKRESRAAFAARFHGIPRLALGRQYYRGVICGTYQFPSRPPERFIFVSHYSSGENPEGLWVSSDPMFQPSARKLCQKG